MTTATAATYKIETADLLAILEAFGIDTTSTLGTFTISSILRACWDLESAKRSLRSHAAEAMKHAERLSDELDRGYSPNEVQWVAVAAERLERDRTDFDKAVDAIRLGIETLACLIDEEPRSSFYEQMKDVCFGPVAD